MLEEATGTLSVVWCPPCGWGLAR